MAGMVGREARPRASAGSVALNKVWLWRLSARSVARQLPSDVRVPNHLPFTWSKCASG